MPQHAELSLLCVPLLRFVPAGLQSNSMTGRLDGETQLCDLVQASRAQAGLP